VGLLTTRPGQNCPGPGSESVYLQGGLRASYFHAWMPSDLRATARFFLPGAIE